MIKKAAFYVAELGSYISGFISAMFASGSFAVSEGFTVTAHSGAMGLPDNSIEAMQAGVENGADIVEFDLNYDSSGEPVLSHDAPKGSCVTLAEAFDLLREHPQIKANVDVKSTEHLELVLPLAQEKNVAGQIFFTGIFEKDVPTVIEKCPGVPYYLNTGVGFFEDKTALAEKVKKLGAIGVNVNIGNITPSLIRACHEKGLLVSVWTINSAGKARFVLKMRPDNVTSRRPNIITEMIKMEK